MADNSYKSTEVRFYQSNLDMVLTAKIAPTGWEFIIHDHTPNQEYKVVYNSNLQETIKLILLGKLYKTQLQAQIKLCDLCGKPTTGQNPHYDCAQKEAYLADSVRELQNNG